MITGFLHPNTTFLFGLDDASVPYLTSQTVSIAFVGTIIAAILALPVSYITSKNIAGKFSKFGEITLILIRTFPEIVLALVLLELLVQAL